MVTKPRTRLTVQDYLAIPEDDENRYELIDGELYMAPGPSWDHQSGSFNLTLALGSFVSENRLGVIRYSPLDMYLSDVDVFQPDIVFISNERLGIIHPDGLHGAPDLVIEVLSPGTERIDRTLKHERYELFDVKEYWRADPATKTITVFRARNGAFEHIGVLGEGTTIETPLLPGLRVDVSTIFDYYMPQPNN